MGLPSKPRTSTSDPRTVNWFQFGRLIHSLYGRSKKLPDLEWIQSLGLLAVKLSQVHALRVDFLEREKCEHLARLYRQTEKLPPQRFSELLKSFGGDDFLARFQSIDDVALASASVGQVHRASLSGGDKVVIKIVKADVRAQFKADVASLERLLRLAIRLYPRLRRVGDPIGILEDVETYTLSELDLRNEIAGQATLRRIRDAHARTFNLETLKFPAINELLSGENVLVSEYVPGPTVDELLERGKLRYEALIELFRLHGFYIFCIGQFHGDLHPGNVLLSGEDFYFVDTGYIGCIESVVREGLFQFFGALADYNYAACAIHLHSMSTVKLDDSEFQQFKADFIKLYSDFRGATVSEVSLTRRMMQTIRLGVNAGMAFDRSIFGVIRSLMYLDGMVLRCNPNAVLMCDMRPLLDEFLAVRQVAS